MKTILIQTAAVSFLAMLFSSCGPRPVRDRQQARPLQAQNRTSVVLLGTGTPNADPDRSGPATAVVVDDTPYLVDCGPGVVRRAAAARRSGVEALRVSNIKHLFITHLHSDHTLGLADLIFTPWVLERSDPLKVYGPPGTQAMVDHILQAYDQDVHVRLDGLEPANATGHHVEVHEIKPGVIYTDGKVRIRAFAVKHGGWECAYGFRFDTLDRSVVISGDTIPTQELVDNAQGCDVLVHEVYSQIAFQKRAANWQRYHKASHTSSHELAELASKIKPGLLILTHQLFWGATEEELLEEVKSRYSGPVVSGNDLDVY